jgi:hypothetical protein
MEKRRRYLFQAMPALSLMRCRADGRVKESRFCMTPTING